MNIAAFFGQSYGYYYQNYQTSDSTSAANAGAILVFALFLLVLVVAVYVIHALLLSRIFSKAGEKGWKAWVPVYNEWKLLELGGQKGYWAVLSFIPVVNIVSLVFIYIAMYRIGLNLGKSDAFVLLAIFLPLVWLIWLAVDDSTWKGKPMPATQTKGVQNDAVQNQEDNTIPPTN